MSLVLCDLYKLAPFEIKSSRQYSGKPRHPLNAKHFVVVGWGFFNIYELLSRHIFMIYGAVNFKLVIIEIYKCSIKN